MKPIFQITELFSTEVERRFDRWIPAELLARSDSARKARLIMWFGALGAFFGLLYTIFYLAIGHAYGAAIIIGCTAGVATTPAVMIWRKKTEPAAHLFAFTLTAGFTALCCVEGGMNGHALAWLVSVPLCALLLLGTVGAEIWALFSFMAAGFVVACDLLGVRLPRTYPLAWEPYISAAGYLGLVIFMTVLGLIFERGRAQAHERMQIALRRLGQRNDELRELNQEKTEFLGMAAHDLKNPLTVIMGYGEMIKACGDASCGTMADEITVASKRMHHLIKRLLDNNAIEEGRYTCQIAPCHLGQLVNEIVEQNRATAQRKHIQIELRPMLPLRVATDSAATLQILDNLVSNAVKYSPAHTTVHVELTVEQGHALVSVRDEGPGLSAEDHQKLFQKYGRLSARPTAGESSTGLGLCIARKLAQLLGGDISCTSQLGTGATFGLRLPLAQHGSAEEIHPNEANHSSGGLLSAIEPA